MGLIRLLLAISVVIVHTTGLLGFSFTGALVSIQSFFMISGFYMSLILNEKYTGRDSYFLFVSNRALRLLPVYWVVLILTIILSLITKAMTFPYWNGVSPDTGIAAWAYIIFTNLFIIGQDTLLFLGIDPATGFFEVTRNFTAVDISLRPDTLLFVPQAWSVALEITFYIIAPFIVRRKLSTVVFILVCSLALRFFIYTKGLGADPWTHRFFPNELAFFLMGNVSYRIYEKFKHLKDKLYNYIIYGLVLMFIVFYNQIPESIVSSVESKQLLFYVLFMLSIPFIFIITKNSNVDKQLGELSYPVYISHVMISQFLQKYIAINPYFGPLVIALSIIFSLVINRFIISPIDIYRQKRLEVKKSRVDVQVKAM